VGTLTAGLSHEIRNPLNAAALQLAVLERRVRRLDLPVQPPLLEPLLLVRDEVRRLEQLVQDFLHFARPGQFVPHPVQIQALLQQWVALFQVEAEKKKVELCASSPALPPVAGMEVRLRQAVVNLVLNALEAVPEGGKVQVGAHSRSGEVWVVVEDS